MRNRFFNPYVGPKYQEGINGKKILVLGASFYCGRCECKFFSECTSPQSKDSSKYNDICPYYANKEGHPQLQNEPTNEIESYLSAYKTFAKFMNQFVGAKDEYTVWDQLAFTNYLQFMSPTVATKQEYLTSRDFDAFNEVLVELQPNIVISWGVQILQAVREQNTNIIDKENLPANDYYLCHMRVPGVPHEISLVSCFHPSSRKHWEGDKELFTKYMKKILQS